LVADFRDGITQFAVTNERTRHLAEVLGVLIQLLAQHGELQLKSMLLMPNRPNDGACAALPKVAEQMTIADTSTHFISSRLPYDKDDHHDPRIRLGAAAEPIRETRRTEAWIVAGCQALVVHGYAEIERLGIGDYRPCIPGCSQESPHEVVLTDRFGTG
jgi:hypothetical protein